MKPKLAVAALVITFIVLAGLVLRFKAPQSHPSDPSAADPGAAPAQPAPIAPGPGDAPAIAAVKPAGTNTSDTDPVAHAQYVDRRIRELNILAMRSDMAARDAILAELVNPDKEIRKGALEASIQFNDRSVIPRLQEVAAQTEDPAEKAEILEAIEFIKLPSLTEYRAAERERMAAAGITNQPRASTNRMIRRPRIHNSGPPTPTGP